MKIFSYGPHALLVEVDSPARAASLRTHLANAPLPGTTETLPGISTVLIRFDPTATTAKTVAQRLTDLEGELSCDEPPIPEGPPVVVRVRYDGEDLHDVAAHTGLSVDVVIEAHEAATYRVALIGMAPGFYFLAGGDPQLHVPRRRSPRAEVPRGAVGLAGPLTGIYPKPGPGGWQLIGRVLDDLWHPTRLPAALLAPATAVRFSSA